MSISKSARSDIVDYVVLGERPFHGYLSLLDFLGRVWNLGSMKAIDYRHSSAYGDIQTHVIQFKDWDYNYLLVERVANFLRENSVRVFYDKYEEVDMWGKDLSEYLHLKIRNEQSKSHTAS